MRVDFIRDHAHAYTFEGYCSQKLREAFERRGVVCRDILFSDSCIGHYLLSLIADPPDRFLTCKKSANLGFGIPEVIFEGPLGVDHSLIASPMDERSFDVVLLEGLTDVKTMERAWRDVQRSEISNPLLLYFQKEFARAFRLPAILNSLKRDVHLFGAHKGENWLVRYKNLYPHWMCCFTEYFDVLKKSKIMIADEQSEWYHAAWVCGCLVCAPEEVDTYLANAKKRCARVQEMQKKMLEEHSWDVRAETLHKQMEEDESHYHYAHL